jgi:hypothetical protein
MVPLKFYIANNYIYVTLLQIGMVYKIAFLPWLKSAVELMTH